MAVGSESESSTAISFFFSRPTGNIYPTASEGKVPLSFQCWVLPRTTKRVSLTSLHSHNEEGRQATVSVRASAWQETRPSMVPRGLSCPPTVPWLPANRSYAPLKDSVRSPRVVDHEAPGAVGLPAQNIRGFCRQRHRCAVGPGSSE